MQRTCIAILLSIFISSCVFSTTPLGRYAIAKEPQPVHEQVEQGDASWYGPRFHGRKTANGERYNQNAMTAAHRTLPIGSVIDVTNPRNGKTVRLRVNDRGPFVKGRIVDLSRAAAIQLDTIARGVEPVVIRIVSKPS